MRYFLKSIFGTSLFLPATAWKQNGVVVLMYHRVTDALAPGNMVISPAKFREQMEYVKAHHEVIPLDACDALLPTLSERASRKSSRLRVAITFDDGYRDNYLHAFPVLRDLGFPAAIFLTAGMTGTNQKRPPFQHLPDPDMLRWEEVKEMISHGISFGSHTLTHCHLPRLSRSEQKTEIESGIATLDRELPDSDFHRRYFCYPYGEYNEETLSVLRELSVRFAFTARSGTNNRNSAALELTRVGMNGEDSLFAFRKKLVLAAFYEFCRETQKRVNFSFRPRGLPSHRVAQGASSRLG